MTKKLFFVALLFLISFLSFSQLAWADWQVPTASAPNDAGASTPLNTSATAQTKTGDLLVSGTGGFGNGLGMFGGVFLLGDGSLLNPKFLFDPTNSGSPAWGKVLMSNDTSGTATWVATSTLGLGGGSGGSADAWTRVAPNIYPTTLTDSVGIGAVPTAGHMLDIKSNQGGSAGSGLRVTYPTGNSLLGTEFGALAHRGGAWSASYAKQGAASWAGYFDGNVKISDGTISLAKTSPSNSGQIGYIDSSGTLYIINNGVNNIYLRSNGANRLIVTPDSYVQINGQLLLSPTAAGQCNQGLGGKIAYNESASGSELDICMKDSSNTWNWKVLKIAP